MQTEDYLRFLCRQIHTVVLASLDENLLPVTAAVDIMEARKDSVLFLTATGKGLYRRLSQHPQVALTGLKGEDSLSTVAISLRGRVRELGADLIPHLFELNPYMAEIYPGEISRQALTVFELYEGSGQWFDLSKKPVEHQTFGFGGITAVTSCLYTITSLCDGCGKCLSVCPQQCIAGSSLPFVIKAPHCLNCGNCLSVCPKGAVQRLRA
ncbi:MAG: 4Fe-4S binding protein [Succinivibrio sp.]|nr:4Fe-4S binding protein [Succinivibrio sp.]